MSQEKEASKLLLVDSAVLPDIFEKVIKAKELLAVGMVKNFSDAAKAAGISRSALYKYKDYVFTHNEKIDERVVTINANLIDRPKVLSGLINHLAGVGANILTLNQNIPIDGVAHISLSLRLPLTVDIGEISDTISMTDGLVDVKISTTR